MQMYYITLGAGATPLVPQDPVVQRNASFQTVIIGAGADKIRVGDASVNGTTNGIPIAAGASLVIPTALLTQNFNGWYAFGTSGDIVSVMILE
jgi:hypothetical protein